MIYLLDTHVLVWAVNQPEKIPSRLLSKLREPEVLPFGVSAITLWEIAMLESRGRLHLSMPLAEWFRRHVAAPFVELLPLTPDIAGEACHLAGDFHGDPADQILVATARRHDLRLVTADRRIQNYAHARTVWD